MSEQKELVVKEVSSEVDAKVVFENGNIKIIGGYNGKGVGAELAITMKAEYFIDKLTEAIPGELDDKLAEYLKVALKIA